MRLRPSQSRAVPQTRDAAGGPADEAFCLEQLAGVFAGPVAAPGVAARRGAEEGEETFRQELLAQMSERLGAEHYGEEKVALAARLWAETTTCLPAGR